MAYYRDDDTSLKTRNYEPVNNGGMGGTLIAVLLVILSIIAIFWYASGSTPENGTGAPAIEATPPAPAPAAPQAVPAE